MLGDVVMEVNGLPAQDIFAEELKKAMSSRPLHFRLALSSDARGLTPSPSGTSPADSPIESSVPATPMQPSPVAVVAKPSAGVLLPSRAHILRSFASMRIQRAWRVKVAGRRCAVGPKPAELPDKEPFDNSCSNPTCRSLQEDAVVKIQ